MSYEDEMELSEKLRLIEEVIADIDAGIQNLRAGAYDLTKDYKGLEKDCYFYIELGERIIQLANKLKGIDNITDDIIPEIAEVYEMIEDGSSLAEYYYRADIVSPSFDEDYAYYIINEVTPNYRYPRILEKILDDTLLSEFENELSSVMHDLLNRFYDYTAIFGDPNYGTKVDVAEAHRLLRKYLANEDKSILDELIEVGEKIKAGGELALDELGGLAIEINEAIIELLEWLRELLQNAYEELKRSVGSE